MYGTLFATVPIVKNRKQCKLYLTYSLSPQFSLLEIFAMMTRKHFKKLAETISGITDEKAKRIAFEKIADMCQNYNPRFNRNKFREACGLAVLPNIRT